MMQELAAYLAVGLCAVFLAARYIRRRATGNCCGERECPATKQMVERIREKAGR